jgi:hypothetical protein
MTKIERLKWLAAFLERRIAEKTEELTASQNFNNALEFSLVANEICDDDRLPAYLKDIPNRQERWRVVLQHFKDLEEREPEKFRYLMKLPILKMIHERAYDAIRERRGMLMVKAKKLGPKMESASLARELKISVATLYRPPYGAT